MRYLRIFFALVFGVGLFFGGFEIIKFINPSISSIDIFSKPISKLLILSIIPFVGCLGTLKWVKFPKVKGISCNSLLLECKFECEISIDKNHAKDIVKDCFNSVFFGNRVLYLSYEDENEVVYRCEKRRFELVEKDNNSNAIKKRLSDLEIVVDFSEVEGKTKLVAVSNNINPLSLIYLQENEQHIKILIDRLLEEKLIEQDK
jgi:hypothetical protein